MSVSKVKAAPVVEVFNIEDEDDEEIPATTTTAPEVPTAAMATLKVGDKKKNDISKIYDIINTARSTINPETGEIEMMDFEQEEVEKILKRIGRAELEDIILKKIVEAVNAHTVVGILRQKCLDLHGLKEKLFQRVGLLERQVEQLSKALKQYKENADRSPPEQKPPLYIKYYRSVGIQVHVETSTQSPMLRETNIPRMTDSNTPAFIQQISNGPISSKTSTSSTNNNNILSPSNGGTKRVNQPRTTVAELGNQVGRAEQPKMARNNSNTSMAAPRQQDIMPMPRNPASGTAMRALNTATVASAGVNGTTSGLIDLTEDNNNGEALILNHNGLPHRVYNQAGTPQGMQLVSSSAGHFVSPQGQSHTVVFEQADRQISPSQTQTRPVFHGINRPAIVQQQQQQRTIPPANLVFTPRPPVLNQLMNGNHHAVGQHGLLGQMAPQVTPLRTFVVPTLPAPTTPMVQQCAKATKEKPPQPELTLQVKDGGIVLNWTHKICENHAEILSYQIFACQQPLNPNPNGNVVPPVWKSVGDVKALPLPMACTLSQFSDANLYYFIVRGRDVYNRSGPFSETVSISLRKKC